MVIRRASRTMIQIPHQCIQRNEERLIQQLTQGVLQVGRRKSDLYKRGSHGLKSGGGVLCIKPLVKRELQGRIPYGPMRVMRDLDQDVIKYRELGASHKTE